MPRRLLAPRLLLGLGLAAAVAIGAWRTGMFGETAAAAGDCTVSSSETAIDAEEQQLLDGINAYRQQNGLTPLALSGRLNQAAAWMSHDMAVNRYFSHTDSLGRDPFVRMGDCGYTYNTSKGENLAAGNADAASTLTQWKNSSGHNANLLGASYRAAGIARFYDAGAPYRWYWSLNLGGYNDGSAAPTATPTATVTQTATAAPTQTQPPSGGTPAPCLRVWCPGQTVTATRTPSTTATPAATATRTPTATATNPSGCLRLWCPGGGSATTAPTATPTATSPSGCIRVWCP